MRIEEKITKTVKEVYVAEDGRVFESKSHCEIYERYCGKSIYDVVADYVIIQDEETISCLKENQVPYFAYIVVKKYIPLDVIKYINFIEVNGRSGDFPNINFENDEPCLFYNNWNNAYSGSYYGSNGWEKIGSKEDILEKIEFCKKRLEYFN